MLTWSDSQLAVVFGLVMERVQHVTRYDEVFDELCCRVNYGMVCRELYNPVIHIGEDTQYDPRDRKTWALNQIDWFIEQVGIAKRSSCSS
jgi:hypothetical protein